MNRGIVMEVKGRSAIVLTPDGQFVRVAGRPGCAVGDELEWSADETAGGRRLRALARPRAWLSAGLAAAVLALVVAGFGWFRAPAVVAYVTMDVNPSIELGLDARERVRLMRALNEGAAPVVEGIDYRGEDVGTVAERIARALAELRFLGDGAGDIVLASVPVKEVAAEWETEVAGKIREAFASVDEAAAPQITSISVPPEVREEAEANGLSAGRMAFWIQAERQGHEVSADAIKEGSLDKIAETWGGVGAVLGGGSAGKDKAPPTDKETWKELLRETKEQREQRKAAGSPGKSGEKNSDRARSGMGAAGKNGNAGGRPAGWHDGDSRDSGGPKAGGRSDDNRRDGKGRTGDSGREVNGRPGANGRPDGRLDGDRAGRSGDRRDDPRSGERRGEVRGDERRDRDAGKGNAGGGWKAWLPPGDAGGRQPGDGGRPGGGRERERQENRLEGDRRDDRPRPGGSQVGPRQDRDGGRDARRDRDR